MPEVWWRTSNQKWKIWYIYGMLQFSKMQVYKKVITQGRVRIGKVVGCITSTNIGNDIDTIGEVAGIYNVIESIPTAQINKLQKKDYLLDLATKFKNVIQ